MKYGYGSDGELDGEGDGTAARHVQKNTYEQLSRRGMHLEADALRWAMESGRG